MSSIENDAHGIEKLLLKTQVSEKFLYSEVNLLIQYIIIIVILFLFVWCLSSVNSIWNHGKTS